MSIDYYCWICLLWNWELVMSFGPTICRLWTLNSDKLLPGLLTSNTCLQEPLPTKGVQTILPVILVSMLMGWMACWGPELLTRIMPRFRIQTEDMIIYSLFAIFTAALAYPKLMTRWECRGKPCCWFTWEIVLCLSCMRYFSSFHFSFLHIFFNSFILSFKLFFLFLCFFFHSIFLSCFHFFFQFFLFFMFLLSLIISFFMFLVFCLSFHLSFYFFYFFFLSCLLSFFFQDLYIFVLFCRKSANPNTFVLDWQLLKSVALIGQTLALTSISLLNISQAFFLTAFMVPVTTLVRPSSQKYVYIKCVPLYFSLLLSLEAHTDTQQSNHTIPKMCASQWWMCWVIM